jgi:hypothetical protein
VENFVIVASVVVRTTTEVEMMVDFVGVIVTVVVEPLQGVVIVGVASTSVFVWVPTVA